MWKQQLGYFCIPGVFLVFLVGPMFDGKMYQICSSLECHTHLLEKRTVPAMLCLQPGLQFRLSGAETAATATFPSHILTPLFGAPNVLISLLFPRETSNLQLLAVTKTMIFDETIYNKIKTDTQTGTHRQGIIQTRLQWFEKRSQTVPGIWKFLSVKKANKKEIFEKHWAGFRLRHNL